MSDLALSNNQLLEIANQTRQLCVNWRSYETSQMISQDDFNFINELDSAGVEGRQVVMDKHGSKAARAFVNLIGQISRDQTVRYLLTLIDDLLVANRDNIRPFHQFAVTISQQPWTPFMNLLSRPDPYISCQAARITSKLATWGKLRFGEEERVQFVAHLMRKLQEEKNSDWLIGTSSALLIILRLVDNRAIMLTMGVDKLIVGLLNKPNQNFQLQYQLVCALWFISFNHAQELAKSSTLIACISDVLRSTEKQKVSRVCLALFRNLLEATDDAKLMAAGMIGAKIQKTLEILQEQPLDDEEMEDDLIFVTAKLQEVEQTLSSFDEFCSEIATGRLQWSPVHTNGKFWRDNCHRFVEMDYKILRSIIHVLQTTEEAETLCVGCHDLGEFVRHYARGRQVLDKINAKQTVMQLMTNEDQKVRYNALIAVQKMMVNNWEILGKQITA